MSDYIREIKRQLKDVYHFTPSRVVDGEPCFEDIPDGDYPMTIEGKLDHIRIVDGSISCCNFKKQKPLVLRDEGDKNFLRERDRLDQLSKDLRNNG